MASISSKNRDIECVLSDKLVFMSDKPRYSIRQEDVTHADDTENYRKRYGKGMVTWYQMVQENDVRCTAIRSALHAFAARFVIIGSC